MQIDLSEEDFATAMHFLFGTLSPADRHLLLALPASPPPAPAPPSFHPQLNPRSQVLVSNMSRARMSIYEYCSVRESVREEHLAG